MSSILRENLKDLKIENDFIAKQECSKAENNEYRRIEAEGKELPENIAGNGFEWGVYFKTIESDLTDDEKAEYLYHKQLESCRHINTIKNCIVFFTVVAVLSMCLSFIAVFAIPALL